MRISKTDYNQINYHKRKYTVKDITFLKITGSDNKNQNKIHLTPTQFYWNDKVTKKTLWQTNDSNNSNQKPKRKKNINKKEHK